MDASGNLTTRDEFGQGHRIRLISYLDPGICLGLHASRPGYQNALDLMAYSVGVAWTDGGADWGQTDSTVLMASSAGPDPVADEEHFFNLSWADDPYPQRHPTVGRRSCLRWVNDGQFQLTNCADPGDSWGSTGFAVDFVDGCWFALNDVFHLQVADIQGGAKEANTPIISFPWNGGHNQIWRAHKVG
jgi:hypothetical protein